MNLSEALLGAEVAPRGQGQPRMVSNQKGTKQWLRFFYRHKHKAAPSRPERSPHQTRCAFVVIYLSITYFPPLTMHAPTDGFPAQLPASALTPIQPKEGDLPLWNNAHWVAAPAGSGAAGGDNYCHGNLRR